MIVHALKFFPLSLKAAEMLLGSKKKKKNYQFSCASSCLVVFSNSRMYSSVFKIKIKTKKPFGG